MKYNYKIQDGCWNCNHVFERNEYDESDSYFCNEDKSERPLCCSVAMNECGDINIRGVEYSKMLFKWQDWSKDREVNFAGICERYSK